MDPFRDIPMLCIGGVRDGELLAYEGSRMEQPRRTSLADTEADDGVPLPPPDLERDVYFRESLTFPSGDRLMFWRSSDLTPFEAIERVFLSYAKK